MGCASSVICARRGRDLAQFAAWALQVLSVYFVLRALDLQRTAGLAGAAAVLVAVNVTAVVPVTPSNVGVFQAACVAVLASFGVSGGHALAYGIVLQAVEVLTAVGLGLPALAARACRGVRCAAAAPRSPSDGARRRLPVDARAGRIGHMTVARMRAVVLAALVCGAAVVALMLSSDHQDSKTAWAIFGPVVGLELHRGRALRLAPPP